MARRRWYGRDRGLSARMYGTMFGLGLVYAVFIAVLVLLLWPSVVLIIVIAGGLLVAQLFFSDRIALAAMGARVTTPDEAPELHATIERLCQLSDLPKPKVAVANTDLPNAFAAGRGKKSATVCVTTGIMQRLDDKQLEGVLAHELSHIANRDVVVMTVASFLATIAALVMRFGLYSSMGRGGRDQTAIIILGVVAASVVVYVLSFFLLRALSRYREYAADRGAAIMTGAPAQLASALERISSSMSRIPIQDVRASEGMNAFFIMPAVAKGFSLSSLVATHPPTEKRIERLLAMQAEMDGTPVPVE